MIELHTVGRRVARRVVGATEWNLRRRIRAGGGRLPADVPHPDWMNSVLKTRRQVDEAIREVDRFALVRHPTPTRRPGPRAAFRATLAGAAPIDRSTFADIPRSAERCESDGAR